VAAAVLPTPQQENDHRFHTRVVMTPGERTLPQTDQTIEDHERDLDNDGEIIAKSLPFIAVDNPVPNVLITNKFVRAVTPPGNAETPRMEWYTATEEVTIMCEMETVTRICLFPLMALGSGEDVSLDPNIPLVSRGAFHKTTDILPPARSSHKPPSIQQDSD